MEIVTSKTGRGGIDPDADISLQNTAVVLEASPLEGGSDKLASTFLSAIKVVIKLLLNFILVEVMLVGWCQPYFRKRRRPQSLEPRHRGYRD